MSRAITTLYQAYREMADSMRALGGQLYDGGEFRGYDPAHLPSEEVSDVIQHNMNYFPELEAATEELAEEVG